MALNSTFTAESCLGFTDVTGYVNHVAVFQTTTTACGCQAGQVAVKAPPGS